MMLLFILSLTVPVIMIVTGIVFLLHPDQNKDGRRGYHTISARRSQHTWNYAQRYAGKIWIAAGILMFSASAVIFQLTDLPKGNLMVNLIIIQLGVWVVTVYPVERALERNFDEIGTPKSPDGKER